MEALEALRTNDTARQRAALAELNAAKEEMVFVGGLLILAALEVPAVQKKLGKVFNGLAVGAFEKAQRAEQRATDALELIDVLKCRVKELERRLERQLPAERRFG
jgi:hypothetical protein